MTPMEPIEPTQPMQPITDAEVAALPLDRGRAQLLEAITSTPTIAPVRAAATPSRRRWTAGLGVAVAAASVAAIVAAPLWLDPGDPGDPARVPPAGSPGTPGSGPTSGVPADDGLFPVMADVPAGWRFGAADGGPISSVTYDRRVAGGLMTFTVEIRPAADRDREMTEQSTQGGVDAGTIDVDGRAADAWRLTERAGAGGPGACTDDCVTHWAAITPPEGGRYALVIGAGLNAGTMTEAEWRALVASVRLTEDRAAFEQFLPADVVLPAEEDRTVGDLLRGVPVPDGFDPTTIEVPDYSSPAGIAFWVGIEATCAWIDAGERPRPETWPLHAGLGEIEQTTLAGIAGRQGEAVRACR